MKILSAPFSFKGESYLGKIYRPYVQVFIGSNNIGELIPLEMIIDTGADYTLLPKRYAQLLNINLEWDCIIDKAYGVGGREITYLCRECVYIKIENFKKVIPVGVLNQDDIPALLGRLQALEILKLTMEKMIITLEK